MAVTLEDYAGVIGHAVVDEIRALAQRVRGRRFKNINSTAVGGGVAELLTRIVPLLADLGIDATWDVIKGNQAFFEVTKAFHNALQGKPETITDAMLETYLETTETNLRSMNLDADVILIHDPQPAGLIQARGNDHRRWVWRCHVDISNPQRKVWDFLQPFVERYDGAIFSMPDFARQLSIPQYMVPPSIDPLSDKNRELDEEEIRCTLERFGIDPRRPILTQISRFDRFKDPLGVIAAYRMVRKRFDCQLVLAGGGATDDPEGEEVLQQVREEAAGDPDIHVLELPPFSDLAINALVRGSTIVFQKSIREGFGLTVSEALWKRKPVIGGAVGGIKLQVINGVTGYLVHSPEGAAYRALELLGNPELRRVMGENGYQHVKQNFLVTRHVEDAVLLLLALDHPDEDIVRLW
ncbi:MAG TPA: glycosyltransferase [Bryobacteraceae bacterium]|nr:glycosyltransferase [Bryobacteraceae bacterium]HOQ45707.1 glycosyltransferase [Bryobacteraceae bacterium]HPQ14290.1 glycosyltransferase [Bryobacteraceae bacterium]HPU71567.1 glycosyltransferase [Bryobacteraceae bacterium]